MKKEALIFGLGVVVGVATIAIMAYNQKNETAQPIKKDNTKVDNAVTVPPKAPTDNNVETDRAATVAAVTERHQEAAQIIKDAVSVICENTDEHESTDAKLEQISSELDDLLSEA